MVLLLAWLKICVLYDDTCSVAPDVSSYKTQIFNHANNKTIYDTCSVAPNVSYVWYVWDVYETIRIWYDMFDDMIYIIIWFMIWYMLWYDTCMTWYDILKDMLCAWYDIIRCMTWMMHGKNVLTWYTTRECLRNPPHLNGVKVVLFIIK